MFFIILVIFIRKRWFLVFLEMIWKLGFCKKIFVIVLLFLIILAVYFLKVGFKIFLKEIVLAVIICFKGLFWIFGKIVELIFLVKFLLLVKIKLLRGLWRVLWVVVVVIWVYGIGFGWKLAVIKLVIWVIFIISLVLIVFVILWNFEKLIIWE